MAMMFRNLRPDEIDCRISQIKTKGDGTPYAVTLLLYKDARCDQNILDETVGAFRWKREHSRDNKNCIVSIWDDDRKQWVSKEDTGTESNTEREKGLASDSFKRACFNWGVGRELYTAPYIEIKTPNCEIKQGKNGKNQCWDNFTVKEIVYENDVIVGLKIMNQKQKKVVFQYGKEQEKPVAEEIAHDEPVERIPQKVDVEITDKAPEPKKLTEAQVYLNQMRKQMQDEFGDEFDFAGIRKDLIKQKVVPDIKSSDLNMEQAADLVDAIYKAMRRAG